MKLVSIAAPLIALCFSMPARAQVPALDHVAVVIMENHSYDQVRLQPYASDLIARYAVCTQSYAVTHPSLPNYLALWAGDTQGITNNNCPPAGSPFLTENLGHACQVAGISWRSYCEDLPVAGSPVCSSTGYERKHAPWTDFGNLEHMNERPLSNLLPDISAGHLPMLVYIVPNQCNSTHDCPVDTGDAWLAGIVPTLIKAVGPRGVVILTWDEDDDAHGNHILTVFAGASVKSGYSHTGAVNHFNVVRTVCDALGLPPMGAATISTPIDDIWAPPLAPVSIGRLKSIFAHQ